MAYPIHYQAITTDVEFYQEVTILNQEAENYLLDFKWCEEIKNSFLYTNLGKVFCIFLFEIVNTQSSADNFLWVVVGDIPPMYLDVFGPRTTKEVVEDYVNLAEDWINNIKAAKSVESCYPFNVEPNIEFAMLLEHKVSFMKKTLMNNIGDIPYRLNSST
ncbi:MAG: hypothetical protein AAGC65_02480 [Mucilaginibacter sp.]|uniref:hypothetical protein n=1 Tax=Mucilaginibacter sp. TaxID=1882438 RepID=UPI0031B3CA5B